MRILMLAQSYAPLIGGEERVVEDLSAELVARGHEVNVVTLRQPAGEPVGGRGVAVHTVGSTLYRVPGIGQDDERHYAPSAPDPETVLGIRRLVRRFRPDVVHAHNWIVHSYLPVDRRSSRTALVLSLHDYGLLCATKRFMHRGAVCTGPGPAKCIRCAAGHYGAVKGVPVALGTRLSERSLRRHVDVFLPVSQAVRDICGQREGEIHRVIPNFIRDLPEPPAADDPRLASLPDGPFILYFGDVMADKGVRHLLEAYRVLEAPPPLILIGRRYIEDLPAIPGVTALGPMPHAVAIEALRRSLFAIAPSIWPEPFGLVALESAAAGKPTVASDIGGLRDIVVDGETGFLVPPGDQESLAAAIRRLLGDAELRAKMGEAARRHAGDFGPGEIVPRFEQAYATAIEARRPRGIAS